MVVASPIGKTRSPTRPIRPPCGEVLAASACVEPLPDFPQGGLIGRVGDRVFPIGEATTITAPIAGPIQLRINDANEGLYDNDGTLTVHVTVGP